VEPGRVDVPAVSVFIEEEGPWREVPTDEAGAEAIAAVRAAAVAGVLRPPPRAAPEPAPAPSRPEIPVPARRTRVREPAPRGVPAGRSLEQIARERHLDNPTLIRGAKLTFYCPPAYLAEVRLTGTEVDDPSPLRRVALGRARLVCRELTLEGDRIVLKKGKPGDLDVRITARGGVDFVTEQRGQVLRHENLRILVIKNDSLKPMR
jgi:hypothetical protein